MVNEETIWAYFDGKLEKHERLNVDQAIAGNEQLAAMFKEISALHHQLKTKTLVRPSSLFIDRVMAAVPVAPVYSPAPKISIKTMLLFALPTIAVIVAFIALLIKNHIPLSVNLPVIDFSRYKLPFFLTDVLLFAYIVDMLPAKVRAGLK